jgi:hypothetical protein
MKVERAPMFSWYDMYSGTYASPAAFNAARPPRFRIVASTARGTVELQGCNPHEEFVRQFEAAVTGSPDAQAGVWEALRSCGDLSSVRAVMLEGDLSTFDWDNLRFTSTPTATDPTVRTCSRDPGGTRQRLLFWCSVSLPRLPLACWPARRVDACTSGGRHRSIPGRANGSRHSTGSLIRNNSTTAPGATT